VPAVAGAAYSPAPATGTHHARTGKPCETDRIRATIPEPHDQVASRKRRGAPGGRPPAFDPIACRRRNRVERGFNRRKHRHAVATRDDKHGANQQATLDLVEMLDRLRAVPDRQDPRDGAFG
jgi:transposase